MKRRGFLKGTGVTLATLPLQTLAATAADNTKVQRSAGQRAIHQDLPYIDQDGLGRPYDAPHGNQATRDYVNSLTQEEFLRRHWFS